MAVKEKKRVQVQIDKELADNTEAVLSQLGLNPTTAINMFYKRIVANGALPVVFHVLDVLLIASQGVKVASQGFSH